MPLYEYLCTSCGHRFERIQKFSDALVTECPVCGGTVEKQISSPAIKFKGAGWYVNDYAKSGSSGKSEKSDSSTKSDEGSKPSSEGAKAETSKTGTETAAPKAAPAADKTDKK